MRKTAIDLFAGAGGTTQGFVQAGYNVLGAIENDRVAAGSYAANHPSVRLLVRDIRYVSARKFRQQLDLEPKALDVITACPPCQGWSSLGPNNIDDPRNDLVRHIFRFIREFRPRAFVVENVPGLRKDYRYQALVDRTENAGYRTKTYEIDAYHFGVPQRRKRLILIGTRGEVEAPPPDLLCALPSNFDTDPRTCAYVFDLAESLGRISGSLNRARRPTSRVLERIKAIPVAGNRFDLPPALRLRCHEMLNSRNAAASYGRIRADEPAPTLTTRCTTPACGRFIHPTEHRGISLLEAALLQTFPSTYLFEGSYGDIEKQIGNALPVRLAEALALAINEICCPS